MQLSICTQIIATCILLQKFIFFNNINLLFENIFSSFDSDYYPCTWNSKTVFSKLWWHTSAPTCKINYVNMHLNHVHMRPIYVSMQQNYVHMQHDLSRTQVNIITSSVEIIMLNVGSEVCHHTKLMIR